MSNIQELHNINIDTLVAAILFFETRSNRQ